MTKRNINCSHPQQNVLLSCWARRQRKPRWNLRWIRAARAALLTRFAAKPQTSLRQGVITNDRRASRHQARTRPLASTRRAGRRPRGGSISPVTACDAHASTKHRKRGYRHSGPSQKTHHRPSYGLALLTRCLVLHLTRYSPASRSLATALPECALARGLARPTTWLQSKD